MTEFTYIHELTRIVYHTIRLYPKITTPELHDRIDYKNQYDIFIALQNLIYAGSIEYYKNGWVIKKPFEIPV